MTKYKTQNILVFLCISVVNTNAQSLDCRGQLSGWGTFNDTGKTEYRLGLRYLPEMNASVYTGDALAVDTEFSANLNAFRDLDAGCSEHDEKLYRLWLRFAGSNYEARIGLQKINFGSALMLRPLMWFDTLDPRDPLNLTDGVWGVLLRYYFLNNANIWLWGLYGNDDLKGAEFIYSREDEPEWGGRIQYPLGHGEIAASYHTRMTDLVRTVESYVTLPFILDLPGVREQRYAVDGKWDYELGFWVEASVNHYDLDNLNLPLLSQIFDYRYLNQYTLGADYTLGWGNGLHIMAEHLLMNFSRSISVKDDYAFTALMLDYPLGIFDQLMTLVMYDHENREDYIFASWQRTYDHWSFVGMVFRYPDVGDLPVLGATAKSLGKGIQIMFIYNH